MNLNPNYEAIGKSFIQQYYQFLDNNETRLQVGNFYSVCIMTVFDFYYNCICFIFAQETNSLMTFEGVQLLGRAKILEKFQSLTFQKIQHVITTADSQPTFDGGVLVTVLGQLKTDDDPPHTFNQTFVLKPSADTFFVEHDIFRLALHS